VKEGKQLAAGGERRHVAGGDRFLEAREAVGHARVGVEAVLQSEGDQLIQPLQRLRAAAAREKAAGLDVTGLFYGLPTRQLANPIWGILSANRFINS